MIGDTGLLTNVGDLRLWDQNLRGNNGKVTDLHVSSGRIKDTTFEKTR